MPWSLLWPKLCVEYFQNIYLMLPYFSISSYIKTRSDHTGELLNKLSAEFSWFLSIFRMSLFFLSFIKKFEVRWSLGENAQKLWNVSFFFPSTPIGVIMSGIGSLRKNLAKQRGLGQRSKMGSCHPLFDGFIPSDGLRCWTLGSGNGKRCVFLLLADIQRLLNHPLLI